jgi:hypothetical protein
MKEFGDKIITIPESATLLLAGGFPQPGKDLDLSDSWQRAFQKSVVQLQRSLEDVYELMAQKSGVQLIICDNGLPSTAAYMPGGLAEFIDVFGVDLAKEFENYHKIFHLETVAIAYPERYGCHNNENRYTTRENAIKHDDLIKDIWSAHTDREILASELALEDKVKIIKTAIQSLLVGN